jgi:hypothetical protein
MLTLILTGALAVRSVMFLIRYRLRPHRIPAHWRTEICA